MKIGEVDRFFEALKDGRWHTLDKIASKANIDEEEAKLIAAFLGEFCFIKIDMEKKKVKLDVLTRKFLENLEKHESAACYEEITA